MQRWLFVLLIAPLSIFAQDHSAHSMHGMYGPYPMTRENSGTTWQPDSTPYRGFMSMQDEGMLMLSGFVNVVHDHQGGPRGDDMNFSNSMIMLMGQRDFNSSTFGLRGMISHDPTIGKSGYPLLLQSGETGDGINPLIDRQHPHDAFMELAGTYEFSVSDKNSLYLYAGLPGEPALGPSNFMMRWSGTDIPEAPIAHHWLDSTHISYGVVTVGAIIHDLKLEFSEFNGREPDQYRWNIESPQLNSESIRVTYNPNENWSMQVSYGWINSPEEIHPEVNTKRATASVTFNYPFQSDNNWQTLLAWGQNCNQPGETLNAYLLESTVNFMQHHSVFMRLERVEKNELFLEPDPLAEEVFTVNKASIGYLYEFSAIDHLKPGLGFLVSAYNIPNELETFYGSDPHSYMIFLRISII